MNKQIIAIVVLLPIAVWANKDAIFGSNNKNQIIKPKDEVSMLLKESVKKGDIDPGSVEESILAVQFALVSYNMRENTFPKSLKELVPDYLDEVPIDPETKKPLTFKIEDGSIVLGMPQGNKKTHNNKKDNNKMKIKEGGFVNTTKLASLEGGNPVQRYRQISIIDKNYVYNPEGRRDPFLPLNVEKVSKQYDVNIPIVQQIELSKLNLKAILALGDTKKAILEDDRGIGYTVKIGDKVGLNDGEVVKIENDTMLIAESKKDFTGKIKRKIITKKLNKKKSYRRGVSGVIRN